MKVVAITLSLFIAVPALTCGRDADQCGPQSPVWKEERLPAGAVFRLGRPGMRYLDLGVPPTVAFCAKDKELACLSARDVVVWDVKTGKERRRWEACDAQADKLHRLRAMALSPDESLLATGSCRGEVVLWETATGKRRHVLRNASRAGDRVQCLAFSANGKMLAAAGRSDAIEIWEVETGKLHDTLAHQQTWSGIESLAFSSDGTKLATSSRHLGIQIWDIAAAKSTDLVKHTNPIRSLMWSADDKTLLGSLQGAVEWDVATGKEVGRYREAGDNIICLARTTDGNKLAATNCDRMLRICHGKAGKRTGLPIGSWQGAFATLAFSKDGTMLATAGSGVVRLWDANKGTELLPCPGPQEPGRAALSPDGQVVAYTDGACRIHLWDISKNQRRCLLDPELRSFTDFGHTARPKLSARGLGLIQPVFSPDGKHLASGCGECVLVWEVASGKEILRVNEHRVKNNAGVQAVAFSPDGRSLASAGGRDKKVCVWDLDKKLCVTTFHVPTNPRLSNYGSYCVAYSPDGKQLAAGTNDGYLVLWDTKTAKEVWCFSDPSFFVTSVAFSPNGRDLAFGVSRYCGSQGKKPKGWIHVVDLATLKSIPFGDHETDHVAFSGDGRQILSTHGSSIDIWETATRKKRQSLQGHEGTVVSLAVSPDGRTAISAGWDATVLFWDLLRVKKKHP